MFLGSLEALPQSLAVFCTSCFSFSEERLCCFIGSFGATSFSIATSFSLALVTVLFGFSFTTLSFFTEGSAFFLGLEFLISFFSYPYSYCLSLFVAGFLFCFSSLLIGVFFCVFLLLSWPLKFLLGLLPL
ncbi:MAG: hypothetical protein Ct9H300mP20_16570 [Gammaproteobacteria bacterium]|nr:MAG: hypothetical protein Ct9H300mP20_16570 [Gammaproteobacteria bacterium]